MTIDLTLRHPQPRITLSEVEPSNPIPWVLPSEVIGPPAMLQEVIGEARGHDQAARLNGSVKIDGLPHNPILGSVATKLKVLTRHLSRVVLSPCSTADSWRPSGLNHRKPTEE